MKAPRASRPAGQRSLCSRRPRVAPLGARRTRRKCHRRRRRRPGWPLDHHSYRFVALLVDVGGGGGSWAGPAANNNVTMAGRQFPFQLFGGGRGASLGRLSGLWRAQTNLGPSLVSARQLDLASRRANPIQWVPGIHWPARVIFVLLLSSTAAAARQLDFSRLMMMKSAGQGEQR